MRMFCFRMAAALATVALVLACSDESESSPNGGQQGNTSDFICQGAVIPVPSHVFIKDEVKLFIGSTDNVVRTVDGQNFGIYTDVDGTITLGDGSVYQTGVQTTLLPFCEANAVYDPLSGELVVESSSSADPGNTSQPTSSSNPVNGSSGVVGTSSSGNNPANSSDNPTNSSSSGNPQGPSNPDASSSSSVPAESSSSDVPRDANGFPTLESYGPPPEAYTKDILSNGKTGWSSRYWDACKPHCSWLSSVDTTSEAAYQAGGTVARNCNIHDVEVPAFTLGHAVQDYWMGYEGTNSACVNNNAGGTYTCTDMAPIKVTDNLSYGYVAAPGAQFGGGCGKCFHLQFNGGNHANDVKETHLALKGKHMIVMASNIGYDVEAGQYDMLVPGGGVGAFNALSTQIGVPASGLGANGGGFLTECQQSLGWDNTAESYQNCVIQKCEEVFKDWPNLLRGCKWYAEWYMAADNPTYNWEEVECPQYLIDHYLTTFNTTLENRWRWHDDWSDYKKGDVLDTVYCWKDGENPKDPNGKGAGCAP
ncbi:MAG: glycosyl hydrolase family 5 [Fibrobacter sp.]|nr:glycosyl hydrolase family 5 [Fibrobacter sp.]